MLHRRSGRPFLLIPVWLGLVAAGSFALLNGRVERLAEESTPTVSDDVSTRREEAQSVVGQVAA